MPKLASIFGLLETLESEHITVQQSRCAVVRNKNASCMKCAEACTSGCIAIVDDQLVITLENCIGCGTCATVCPTCALDTHNPDDSTLLQAIQKAIEATQGELIITCEQNISEDSDIKDPERLIVLTCLGRMEETLLTSAVLAGATKISLVKADCVACRYSTGLTTAQAVCATTNTLLAAWNSATQVEITDALPPAAFAESDAGYDAGKREFFTGLFKDAKTTALDFAANKTLGEMKQETNKPEEKPRYLKVDKDGVLPRFLPPRRENLLKNLVALGTPQDILVDTRLFGHAIIDLELCDSCQMCATFCPTGALSKFKSPDGTFGLYCIPSICVKCRCCTDICNAKAITLSEEVFAVDIPQLAKERIVLKPLKRPIGGPNSIHNTMKYKFGIDEIYER